MTPSLFSLKIAKVQSDLWRLESCHGKLPLLWACESPPIIACRTVSTQPTPLLTFPEVADWGWQQQRKTTIFCDSTGGIPIRLPPTWPETLLISTYERGTVQSNGIPFAFAWLLPLSIYVYNLHTGPTVISPQNKGRQIKTKHSIPLLIHPMAYAV